MKKYKSNTSCQKCGNNVTVDKYCKAITYPPAFVETEHISRTCLNCGYEWSELPLDSEVDE